MTGTTSTDATSPDRKSTRLNSSHLVISYAVFCLKKKKTTQTRSPALATPIQLLLVDKHCSSTTTITAHTQTRGLNRLASRKRQKSTLTMTRGVTPDHTT